MKEKEQKKVNKDVPQGEVLITLSPSMKQSIESKKILESLPLMEQTKKKVNNDLPLEVLIDKSQFTKSSMSFKEMLETLPLVEQTKKK